MNSAWGGRLRRMGGEAHELHEAAELAELHHSGRPGSVFSKVTDIALLASVVLSGAAGAVHLKKEISKSREGHHEHSSEHGHRRSL